MQEALRRKQLNGIDDVTSINERVMQY